MTDVSRSTAPTPQAERYRTLLEINNAVVSSLTRETLFSSIVGALRRILRFERAAIFLYDPARDVLRLYMLDSSVASDYFHVGLEVPAFESHMGRVFGERRPLLRSDLAVEREYPAEDHALADGIRAFVSVPLIARGKAIGTLAMASTEPGRYSQGDADFLEEVAGQIALAVANMQAYQEIADLQARLQRENVYLQEEIQSAHNFAELVGGSAPLRVVLQRVEQVAPTESTVLVVGETGTGKELIARAIHSRSRRRNRPLVKVDCASIAAGLVESELFGHVKGAFTGAIERRIGRFELADHGTVFLDEVGELPPEAQAKLLRVLQEREFEPVGSNRTVKVDVRVIAATNRDLEAAVAAGRFRADLYYRLNVFPLAVPPLRDRREDLPQLVTFFLARFAKALGKPVKGVSSDTMARLSAYHWPGNVREVQNVVERAVVLSQGPVLELTADLLPSPAVPTATAAAVTASTATEAKRDESGDAPVTLESLERAHIVSVLERTSWVIQGPRGAAAILGLHPNTLRSRIERLGIARPRHDRS